MRLVTYDREGEPRAGLVTGEYVIDAADGAEATGGRLPTDMLALIEGADASLTALRAIIDACESDENVRIEHERPLHSVRLLAPIPRPARNVVCVGLNYAEHASESAVTQGIPEVPVFFTKPSSTVIGPEAAIPWHGHVSRRIDWEVELVAVIGKRGRDIAASDALAAATASRPSITERMPFIGTPP